MKILKNSVIVYSASLLIERQVKFFTPQSIFWSFTAKQHGSNRWFKT